MPRTNHIHRYAKVNLAKRGRAEYWVYKCQKAACSHYVPLALAIGKMCECNRCYRPMIISKVQMNGSSGGPMAKPHCVDCIGRRKSHELISITKFLEETTEGTENKDDTNENPIPGNENIK